MNRFWLESAIAVVVAVGISRILPVAAQELEPRPPVPAEEFTQAARDGNLDRIKELVQCGVQIDCENIEGLTAIETAQIAGQRNVQEYLASLGATTKRELPPLNTWLSRWLSVHAKDSAPAVVIQVTQNDQVLFEDARGLASIEQQLPVSVATRFRIASVTKQFTAVAVLKLQEERRISVQDSVSKYIPDYPNGESLTIHHLLTHTGGIVDYSRQQGFLERVVHPISPTELLGTFRTEPLEFKPGSDWKYSNSGYVLLGQIIEIAANEPYGSFLKSRFFDPLRMNDTGVFTTDRGAPHEVIGYAWSHSAYNRTRDWDMSHTGGAGTLYSTVRDLNRWNEKVFCHAVLNTGSMSQALTAVAIGGESEGRAPYGYGWFVKTVRGLTLYDHSGGIEGFSSYLAWYPEEQLSIAILANSGPSQPGMEPANIGRRIAEYLLWRKMNETPAYNECVSLSSKTLAALTGEYDYGESILTVRTDGLRLFARIGRQQDHELVAKSATEFCWPRIGAELSFVKNGDGHVMHAVHSHDGRVFRAKRLIGRDELPMDSMVLASYTGTYESGRWRCVVSMESDKLFIRVNGNDKMRLVPRSLGEFYLETVNGDVRFSQPGIAGHIMADLVLRGQTVHLQRIDEGSGDAN